MHYDQLLGDRFEENRGHLRAVAYRMLGSLSEAEDAVQEAWLHVSRADATGVKNLGGWLTTVVARVCLDMLRSRRSRHEEPLDTHVPDPVVGREDGFDPEQLGALEEDARRIDRNILAEQLAYHGVTAVRGETVVAAVKDAAADVIDDGIDTLAVGAFADLRREIFAAGDDHIARTRFEQRE